MATPAEEFNLAGRRENSNVGSDTILPWHHESDRSNPLAEAAVAGVSVPVAWLGRTSTEEQQDPTLSLPRQLRGSRQALPDGYVIVAHFYDVESGRKDLDERGKGRAHEKFDIPIPRDGGIQDLLAEAKRPDRRFVAVICESIERVARRTYFGTKVEYELEQSGVALLAADEPITELTSAGRGPRKKATTTLTRRVKQAIAEWYVLQMLELSWDGFREHTEQGWNIGRPPYGYQAEKRPHPVPARRAEGRTKTRLVPDPVTGPVVTKIFHMRALDRHGYDHIADQLNIDLERNPPPMPVDPRRAVGRWTGSAVRGILTNPKYTGYMVWNRRASKQGGHHNPLREWVWSPRPTHEPLVTKELFEAASPVAKHRQGSRDASGPNSHRQTKRSYQMRSYVTCDLCDRRMFGKTRKGDAYFACEPPRQHHAGRSDWYDDHPKSLWVREDVLIRAVHDFFAERVFGPQRQQYLHAKLGQTRNTPADEASDARKAKLASTVADLQRRQDNLMSQLEVQEPTGDPQIDREYRASIQRRFAELAGQRRDAQAQLSRLNEQDQSPASDDLSLLEEIPQMAIRLDELPEDLQRRLYDAFQLQVRYNKPRHEARIRVTIREDTARTFAKAASVVTAGESDISPRRSRRSHASTKVSHVLGAPGRIRTCGTRFRKPLLYPLSYEGLSLVSA